MSEVVAGLLSSCAAFCAGGSGWVVDLLCSALRSASLEMVDSWALAIRCGAGAEALELILLWYLPA